MGSNFNNQQKPKENFKILRFYYVYLTNCALGELFCCQSCVFLVTHFEFIVSRSEESIEGGSRCKTMDGRHQELILEKFPFPEVP